MKSALPRRPYTDVPSVRCAHVHYPVYRSIRGANSVMADVTGQLTLTSKLLKSQICIVVSVYVYYPTKVSMCSLTNCTCLVLHIIIYSVCVCVSARSSAHTPTYVCKHYKFIWACTYYTCKFTCTHTWLRLSATT